MKWAARFTSGGVQGWVVEHSYTRGAGKSRRTFTHTMVAVPVPVSWAMTSVTRPTILTIVKGWMGTKDMQLDSAVFNKAFHITTSDENFALVLLTPEVQEWMLAAPRNWNFCVSQGLLRVYAPQTAAAKVLPALLDAPSELLARTTPELF